MDDLTLSIGDLARRTGVDIPTLRRWERYDGLLAPTRTPGGQRRYGPEDVAAVQELVSLIGKGWAAASAARAVAAHRDTGAIVFDASLLDAVPTGVIVTNADAQVLYANPAIAALVGMMPAELEEAGGGNFLDEDEALRVFDAFKHLREGEAQTYDVRMRTATGEVDVEVSAGPLLGPGGRYRGVVGVFHDLTRLRDAERRAAVLARLVDLTEHAMLAVDADLRLVAWNSAASILASPATELAPGVALDELLADDLVAPTVDAARRAADGETTTFGWRADPGDRQVRVLPLYAGPGRAGAIIIAVAVAADHAASQRPDTSTSTSTSTAYHGVIAAVTQSILTGVAPKVAIETAVRGVGRALDASHVSFLEVVPDTGELAVVASTADEPSRTYPPVDAFGSHVGFALQAERPIVVHDFDTERRFDRGPSAGEQAARSGLCVPVRWRPHGRGAMTVHSSSTVWRDLGSSEVTFVQSAANVCALALQGIGGPTGEPRA